MEGQNQNQLDTIFERFLQQNPIFVNKSVLQANFLPESVPHRDAQVEQIGKIMAPALQKNRPSNLFVYGKTGTGKTLTTTHVLQKLEQHAHKKNLPVKTIYLNCKLRKSADTEYRLIAQLLREFGQEVPATGLPTEDLYRSFSALLNQQNLIVILVLDEIDQLVKKVGDGVLYTLTRMNSELANSQLAVIGISNDLTFTDGLDPRVRSSLSEEEILFPSYNALQIQDILRQRAAQAFRKGVVAPGVIEKCAAYAAKEHGDARRALELLRVSGELAERNGEAQVTIPHLDQAEDKIEREVIIDSVLYQPKQFQVTLAALLSLHNGSKGTLHTGEIYSLYLELCKKLNLRPLTQRRISDILSELDMLGIVNAKVISKGRYGRTREITVVVSHGIKERLNQCLKKELSITI